MSPVVVEAEVDISRPPEEVFDYCSDPGREPEWNPMMKTSKKITDGPLGVGSRYATEFVKGPPMVMECVGYERPAAWSLVGRSSALQAGGGGRVLPAADGSHLIMRMELEPRGLLRLAAPLLRRRMKPMLERDLANIKSVLEGGSGRGPRASRE
jgi:polyketide cyclase/dehydrase/lipid transport protein